jgi:ribonucleotide monophosphatase NagD (HAD superfamily)
VGDNLDTDILGANEAGIDSALCLGGVLMNTTTPIAELAAKIGAAATYSISAFKF